MALPEATKPLSPKEAREFLKRLNAFRLTQDQKKFWSTPSQTQVKRRK